MGPMHNQSVTCSRCGAPCVVGHAFCWRCGGSLLRRMGAPMPLAVRYILLLAITAAVAVTTLWFALPRESPAVSPPARAVSLPAPAPGPVDPLVERARAEIAAETGGASAVPAADGRIHLRSGGSVSPEEWDRARRAVHNSQALRSPTVPEIGQ